MQEDLDFTTRNRNELEREIQGLRTTIRKNSTIMETQRVDLGTYKTSLGRLEKKYNDIVAELDEANNEIVEREAGIEKAGAAIFDLRAQVDRLNGELAEAESATTKAEAERDRIQRFDGFRATVAARM
jgi:chromosome segregation ATPase